MPPPTPSTAPTRMAVGALSHGTCLKSEPKPILFFHVFSMPLWIEFGSDLGAILDPFGRPNRPKFSLRCPSKRYLRQKRAFTKHL